MAELRRVDRMVMTPTQMTHRIEQNTNDIASIYELLAGINTKLEEHERRFDAIDARLDGIDAQLEALTANVGEILALLRPGRA